MLTHDGHVSEGSAENLFMVRDGVFITPPVTEDILEGITRDAADRPDSRRARARKSSSAASTAPSCTPATSCSCAARARRSRRSSRSTVAPSATGDVGALTRRLQELLLPRRARRRAALSRLADARVRVTTPARSWHYPVIDVHTHLMPERLFQSRSGVFSRAPVAAALRRVRPKSWSRTLLDAGVSRFVFMPYAHRGEMSRSLNHWVANVQATFAPARHRLRHVSPRRRRTGARAGRRSLRPARIARRQAASAGGPLRASTIRGWTRCTSARSSTVRCC